MPNANDSYSEDHRGTPEAPGRVVTLIDRMHYEATVDPHSSLPDEKVWGAAYHIPGDREQEVRDYLDIREINGYSIQYAPFHPWRMDADKKQSPGGSGAIECLVYIGLPDNPQFLGPQDPGLLAAHILRSRGPSGENKEYLYKLEQALFALSPNSEDHHVSDIARRCRQLEVLHDRFHMKVTTPGAQDIGPPLHRAGSTEEQEEIQKET